HRPDPPLRRFRRSLSVPGRHVFGGPAGRAELAGDLGRAGRLELTAGEGDRGLRQLDHRGHLQDDFGPARVRLLERDDPEPRKETGLVPRIQLAAILVSVAGIAVSMYLTALHYAGVAPACPATGPINCEAVLSS